MSVDTTEYREFHSAEEAELWAETNYSDFYGARCDNKDDYKHLYFYAGSAYKLYNTALRLGYEYDEEDACEIQRITDILEHHTLPEPVIAYRYTHKRVLKKLLQGKRPHIGLRFADKAFFSTSLVKSSLDEFKKTNRCDCLLKLYVPKGMQGIYISLKGTNSCLNEQELLLQRDTEFEIIKTHLFHYPIIIECKAIIKSALEE